MDNNIEIKQNYLSATLINLFDYTTDRANEVAAQIIEDRNIKRSAINDELITKYGYNVND